MVGYESPVCL